MPPCGISALRASGAAARWYAAYTSATRGTPCDVTSHSPSLSAIRHSAVGRGELPDALILWRAIVVGRLGRSSCEIIAITLRAMRRCCAKSKREKVGAQRIGLCAARCARMVVSVSDYLPTSRRATARTRDAAKAAFSWHSAAARLGFGAKPQGVKGSPLQGGKG